MKIVIEGRYIGPFKIPEWGVWREWRIYDPWQTLRADEVFVQLRKQFEGMYEFRMVDCR